MSIPRSLLRASQLARPVRLSSPRLTRVLLSRSASSSPTPTEVPPPPPNGPTNGPTKPGRPALRSFAQIKAQQAVEQHRLDTLRGSGWHKSDEQGHEDQEERTVYSRPNGPSMALIWTFMASQVAFLVSLIDMQAGTTFLLPPPKAPELAPAPPAESPTAPNTLPDDPPAFTPEAYKTSAPKPVHFQIPRPQAELDAEKEAYRPPYLAFFALTVVCVGLPLGLIQGWAKTSIVRITSLRPSGKIKIVTTKDEMLRWVRKQGTIVDTGVATESFLPDGVKVSPYVTLYLPDKGKTVQRKIDLSTPRERELETAKARNKKIIVDRDLIKQTFEGIEEAA